MTVEATCVKCERVLPAAFFPRRASKKNGLHSYCSDCNKLECKRKYLENKPRYNLATERYYKQNKGKIREYHRQYESANRAHLNAEYRRRHQERQPLIKERAREAARKICANLKAQVYGSLGGQCYCCELSDARFLTIDHINNDGHKDRKRGKSTMNQRTFLQHVLAQGCPRDKYRLACYNCNMGRAFANGGGICPHEIDRQSIQS